MNICIYGYYKIDIHSRQSVRVGFDDFEQWEEDCTIKRNGTELIELIKKCLEDNWFQDITFNGDETFMLSGHIYCKNEGCRDSLVNKDPYLRELYGKIDKKEES